LDDDDEWLPYKTEAQLKFVTEHQLTGNFIVACRMELRAPNLKRSLVAPTAIYQPGTDLSEYLWDRRSPIARAGMIGTTPLFPRSVVERVPFLRSAHDDTAWILECAAGAKIPLYMVPDVGYVYHLALSSRNQRNDWRNSVEMARTFKARACVTPRAFAGLLSTTTAWRAKRQEGLRGILELTRIMYREGQPRATHWISLGLIALAPLNAVEALRLRRRR
jgi:hypothetical protein